MVSNLQTSERELLLAMKAGDHVAFEKLYQFYSPRLIANLIPMLKNDVLVEEVLQETFMTLWEKRGNVDPDQKLGGYLFRIAANKVKNLFKRAQYDIKMRHYLYPAIEAGYEHIETALFRKENESLLHELLEKLPSKQREVYRLCKLQGKTYKEVSELLQISTSTVNSHILRANSFLKQELTKYPEIALILCLSFLSV